MINRIVLILLGCFFTLSVSGQSGKVLLKNGSVLYGNIGKLDAMELELLIEEELISLPRDMVRMVSIKKKIDTSLIDKEVYKSLSLFGKRGIEKSIQVGLLHGREDSDASARETFSGAIQVSYRVSSFVQPGISVGYDHHDEFGIIPVLLTYKFDLSPKWSTPFLYGSAGYGFAKLLEEDDINPGIGKVNGGLNYQLGLGYRWRLEKIGFEFAIGWKCQKVDFEYGNFDWFWTENESNITLSRSINRAEFKFGIIF
ncbi:MAG: hypothetical protein AAGA02_14265 [Bacteroidota bacterium]